MADYTDIIGTIFIAFIIAVALGPIVLPLLRKLNIGQSIREDGPQTHLKKTGTPTMGGIIIMIAMLITLFLSGIINADLIDKNIYILILATLGFGMIGLIDDYIIVVKKRNLGLKAYQKLIGQILLAILLALYHSSSSELGTKLIVPFLDNQYIDLGALYIPFIVFVVVGTVNSVNLTDGLDGLASGVTLIVLSFFAIVAFSWGMISISIFALALAGSCLGFLMHNAYPAKVFMGDTGSLALGGAVSAIAVLLNLPLIIPIVGGIYFIEALSVIIQVVFFKLKGKRVFLMSPLHHHYEQKGWKETKIVLIFWTITLILCMIGIYSLT